MSGTHTVPAAPMLLGALTVLILSTTAQVATAATALPFSQLAMSAEIAYVAPDGSLRRSALDGSNQATVVDGPVLRPAWSPDGTRIAYIRARTAASTNGDQIEIIQADGTGRQTVPLATRGISRVRWDPSGGALYYIAGDGDIHRTQLETGQDNNFRLMASDLDVAANGTVQFIHGVHSEKMAVWESGRQPWDPLPGGTPPMPVYAVAFSPEADWYALSTGPFLTAQQLSKETDERAPHRFVLFLLEGDAVTRPARAVTWLGDGSGIVFERAGADEWPYLWAAVLAGDKSTPVRLFPGREPAGRPRLGTGTPGAISTSGAIGDLYARMGGSASWLGSPITSVEEGDSVQRQQFEQGMIVATDGLARARGRDRPRLRGPRCCLV